MLQSRIHNSHAQKFDFRRKKNMCHHKNGDKQLVPASQSLQTQKIQGGNWGCQKGLGTAYILTPPLFPHLVCGCQIIQPYRMRYTLPEYHYTLHKSSLWFCSHVKLISTKIMLINWWQQRLYIVNVPNLCCPFLKPFIVSCQNHHLAWYPIISLVFIRFLLWYCLVLVSQCFGQVLCQRYG